MARRDLPTSKLTPEQFMRSLMAGTGLNSRPDIAGLEEVSAFIKSAFAAEAPKKTRASEWRDGFVRLLNLFSKSIRPLAGRNSFSINKIYASGMIVGTCHSPSATFNLFAHRDGRGVLAGCSCQSSSGRYACEHSYLFVQHILGELSDSTSNLVGTVESGKFTSGNQDMSIFAYDNSLQILSMLERISNVEVPIGVSLDELATVVEREPARIAWNIDSTPHGIRIEPVLQTAKKRGGFGKGRRTRLGSLFQPNLQLSPADERIRALVQGNTDYYNSNLTLPTGEAIYELVGEPNVQLNGEPATVVTGCGILHLVKRADGYRFFLESNGDKQMVTVAGNFLVSACDESKQVTVFPSSPSQLEMIRELLKLPPIAEKHEKAIFERAKKLQSVLSVRLPDAIGGELVPDFVTPSVILRSRKDGALDYGIRVRDSAGKLHRPCQGVMIHADNSKGKPRQLVRQVAAEEALANDVTNRLGLGKREYEGTLQDFSTAFNLIEVLQTTGDDIEVLWDRLSEKPMKVLGTVSANNVRVGVSQKRDWFNLTGECKFGEETLDIATLMQSLRDASVSSMQGDYIKVGDAGWARISEKLRKSLRQLDDSVNQERGTLRFDKTSAHALRSVQEHFQFDASKAWNDCLQRLDRSEKLEPVLPTGLKATLRDYQLEGFKWLRRLAEWGVGGVLADDMGLGKTIQTLAVILDRAKEGPALVIAPTSVGFNWMREIEKFAPDLSASLYRETDRADFLDAVGPNQIVVCSYGLALRDIEKLAKVEWGTLVLDEAQAIKNSRSKTSMAIATIPSKWTVALTGTPVENHLGELWSLFHVVSPGVLGGWDQFRNRFASPIEKENDNDRRTALRSRLTPFILRRTKGQVLKDLPARTEMNLVVELSPAERAIYEKVRMSAIGEADAIAKLNDIQDQRFRILALLTRLRQIACHPRMVHDTWTEGSAKLTQLSETLLQLREEGHRVLIFSQFVKHLALIREMMDAEGVTYQYLDGSTPAAARQQEVDKFQNGDATAFLISLKAGGTGLNLTAADYVIHMDPWWNPAVEDQATDRAHRIGQDKPVMVYRIVAKDTIEEEILKLHDTKRDLVAGILDGTHTAAKLSTKDLIDLLRS
jgi:superfamily II DNA or RNA helicase